MNNLEIVLTILGMGIILIFLLNYKNSMEPFQNNFQSELISKLTTLDDKIKILNEDSKDFSINKVNSLNSHSCDLYQKVNQKNNNILDNEFKDTKVKKMKEQVMELDKLLTNKNIKMNIGKKYKGIKSMNNGVDFSVEPIDVNRYLLKMNNGCLGIKNNDYDIYECNPTDKSQHFRFNNVFNEYGYASYTVNQDYIEDKDNINYPFVMVQSINNENCVSNNHNNIRVMPCNMLKSQRFELLEDEVCH